MIIPYLNAIFLISIDLRFLSYVTKPFILGVYLFTVGANHRKKTEILYDACIDEIQIKLNRE